MTAYKNRDYGIWIRTFEDAWVYGAAVADNRAGFYPASEGHQFFWDPDFASNGHPIGLSHMRISGCLFIGESSNIGEPSTTAGSLEALAGRSLPHPISSTERLVGVEIYDGFFTVDNCVFANFNDLTVSSLSYTRISAALSPIRTPNVFGNDPRNLVYGTSFVNVQRRVWMQSANGRSTVTVGSITAVLGDQGTANAMLLDLDGSVSGNAGSWLIPYCPLSPDANFLVPPTGSTINSTWNAVVTSGAPFMPYAQFQLDSLSHYANPFLSDPWEYQIVSVSGGRTMSMVAAVKNSTPEYYTEFVTNLIVNESYDVDPVPKPGSTTPVIPGAFIATLQLTEPNRWIIVSVPIIPPTASGTGAVQVYVNNVFQSTGVANLGALQTSSGNQFWHDSANDRIYLRLETGSAGATGLPAILNGTRTSIAVFSW